MEIKTNKKNWNITVDQEREIWKKELLNTFIPIKELCQNCNKGFIGLKNNDSIINPLIGKCNYYKCRKELYLRKGALFEYNSRTPASVLLIIIKLWLCEDKNVKDIGQKLKELYSLDTLNNKFIYIFIDNCRKAMTNYIRQVYSIDPLAELNKYHHVAIDKSLFTHEANFQIWVVGLINNETNDIRMEIVQNRNQDTLKAIVEKHVKKGNIIISDSLAGYIFLNSIDSGYTHHVYNHGHGNFGHGLDSTSRIESILAEIKALIKKLYHKIPYKNFVYFLRESEYRRSLKSCNLQEKIEKFSIVLSCVGNGLNGEYLSEDDLISWDYETMFEN